MPTEVVIKRSYKGLERAGVAVLGVAGLLSALSILVFTTYVLRTVRVRNQKHKSTRTHVGVYIVCYLLADFIKAIASIINLQWVADNAVQIGEVCSLQGILKQLGDVATAIWSVVIALHLFNLLFWRWEPRKYSCYATCIGCWALTGMVVFIGPTILRTDSKGDFWGVAGHWCWITQPYSSGRITLEYLWMFLSSAISFFLYFVVFLRLRGNIYTINGHWKTRWISSENSWRLKLTRDNVDGQILGVVRILLWFPIVYIITVLPMAICRFVEQDLFVPFGVTFATNIPFSLSGILTVALFALAIKALPNHDELPTFVVPRKEIRKSVAETGIEPFILPPAPMTQVTQAPLNPVISSPAGRSRSNSYGVAHTLTRPSLDTTTAPLSAHPVRGRSLSADSLSSDGTRGKYKAKWQGGNLQLSHSNLQPKVESLQQEEVRGRESR